MYKLLEARFGECFLKGLKGLVAGAEIGQISRPVFGHSTALHQRTDFPEQSAGFRIVGIGMLVH